MAKGSKGQGKGTGKGRPIKARIQRKLEIERGLSLGRSKGA